MDLLKRTLAAAIATTVIMTGALAAVEAHAGLLQIGMINNKAIVYQDDANSEIVIGYEGKMNRLKDYAGENFRVLTSQNYQGGFLVLSAISNGTSCEMNTKLMWFTGKEVVFADGIPTCYAQKVTSRLKGNQMTVGFDGKSKTYPLIPPESATPAAASIPKKSAKGGQACYDAKLKAFSQGMGLEAPISYDMMNEWRSQCGLPAA